MSSILPLSNCSMNRAIAPAATPVGAFKELYGDDEFGFLYESLESRGERGRYSFIGGRPLLLLTSHKKRVAVMREGTVDVRSEHPFRVLKDILAQFPVPQDIKPFCGGAVGYVSYDAVRLFEPIPDDNSDEFGIPDVYFLIPSELIVFDHAERKADIVMIREDNRRLEEMLDVLSKTDTPSQAFPNRPSVMTTANHTEDAFCMSVERAKEYIFSGDIFQVVLSQRFSFPLRTEPLSLYRALRITNPSPYMYFLKLKDTSVLGSSPETLVKLIGRKAISRPLAGTRPRGDTPDEDRRLAVDLLHDEKERAEHVMLVDLARNDLGRVCEAGSVEVSQSFEIERYSKVMHLVSHVEGILSPDNDCYSLFEAAFPAGTVSGAPKIRAMEIIDELEPVKRGVYAGAIGYFDFCGNMDFCIGIRTILLKGKRGYIQAGAGIVADSDPSKEYRETMSKINALQSALELAG